MNDFETRLQSALVRGIPGKSGGIVDAAWLDPAELTGPDWRYRNRAGAVAGLITAIGMKRVSAAWTIGTS